MAGIQVPKITRSPDQMREPSVGRIDYKPVDTLGPMKAQNAAAEKLVEHGATYYLEEKKRVMDVTALAEGNDLHQYMENGLEGRYDAATKSFIPGVKHQKGDPVTAFKSYDDGVQAKYDEILNKYKDADTDTLNTVKKKLDAVQAKFFDRRSTAFAARDSAYTTSVSNDGVKNAQNDMMQSTAHLDISDPNTTVPLDQKIAEILDIRTKEGLKNGSVVEIKDDKGQLKGYNYNPSVKLQIAKDTSEGLSQTIKNLLAAGDAEGADFLLKKYNDHLDKVIQPQVAEKVNKTFKEQQGVKEFNNVRLLPTEDAFKKLEQIQDPDVRKKAELELDTYRRRMENMKSTSSKNNYNTIAKIILEKQNSGSPFTDVNDMNADPTVKRLLDNVKDAKQLIALNHMVAQPKDSSPEAKANAYDMMTSPNGFKGVSQTDFQEVVAGLNKEDRKRFENVWSKQNSQTNSEEGIMYKRMGSKLRDELNALGYVKKNTFGKYDNDNTNKIIVAQDALTDAIAKMPPNLSYADQDKYVREFAASYKKKEVFNPSPSLIKKFNGSFEKQSPDTSSVQGVKSSPDDIEFRKRAMSAFYKSTIDPKTGKGRWPDLNSNELDSFIKKTGFK